MTLSTADITQEYQQEVFLRMGAEGVDTIIDVSTTLCAQYFHCNLLISIFDTEWFIKEWESYRRVFAVVRVA